MCVCVCVCVCAFYLDLTENRTGGDDCQRRSHVDFTQLFLELDMPYFLASHGLQQRLLPCRSVRGLHGALPVGFTIPSSPVVWLRAWPSRSVTCWLHDTFFTCRVAPCVAFKKRYLLPVGFTIPSSPASISAVLCIIVYFI